MAERLSGEQYEVHRLDVYPIFNLGRELSSLENLCETGGINGFDQILRLAVASETIAAFFDLQDLKIIYSRSTLEALQSETDELYEEVNNKNELKQNDFYKLENLIREFKTQLAAELPHVHLYLLPDQGIFNTTALVDRAHEHIHRSQRIALPEFALSEIRAAGRCLAFQLFSASGYHSARAVESVLRHYYITFIKSSSNKKLTLGGMTHDLQNIINKQTNDTPLPNGNTVRYLRDFTQFDRNPLIHASDEITLEESDAFTFFNSACDVIGEMAKELIKHGVSEKTARLDDDKT